MYDNFKAYMVGYEPYYEGENYIRLINYILEQFNHFKNEEEVFEMVNIINKEYPHCWSNEVIIALFKYYMNLLNKNIDFNRGHIPYALLWSQGYENYENSANKKFVKKMYIPRFVLKLIKSIKRKPLRLEEINSMDKDTLELWHYYRLIPKK